MPFVLARRGKQIGGFSGIPFCGGRMGRNKTADVTAGTPPPTQRGVLCRELLPDRLRAHVPQIC